MDGDATSFVGYYISLTCNDDSIFEGEVLHIEVDSQLITLTHAHQLLPDGSAVKYPQITISGDHVKKLKIIRERINVLPFFKDEKPKNSNSNENRKTSPPADDDKPFSPKLSGNDKYFFKPDDIKPQTDNYNAFYSKGKSNGNDIDPTFQSYQNKGSKKKNICFGADAEKIQKLPEFDFEENLAKFDKQAVFERMSEDRVFDPITSSMASKMRPQDNVLESVPVSLRQIKVPLEHTGTEYSTEDGFIVPAISLDLKLQLFSAAEEAGLSRQQLVENAGICTCQMALQLVGGSLRINPKNDHQRPEIVVLAGHHTQGLQAVCAARHLVNHTAKVVLYLPSSDHLMQSQVDLFLKSGGKLITSYKDLPTQPVDIIIDAMFGMDKLQHAADWLPYAISWANQNKAPLLSIDPCMPDTKCEFPDIKWCIAMGLPLIEFPKAGSLYLADVGIPRGVFKDVGIQYMSPFTDKFYIPIYDR